MQKMLPLLIALFTFNAVKSNLEQYNLFRKASKHGLAGQQKQAVQGYQELLDRYPAGYLRCEASFNLAVSEFSMKHYRRAADLFASLPPGNSSLSRSAVYNRGNALAMTAFSNRKTPDDQEKELLGRALSCYRKALLDNPANSDARINFEIVTRAMQRHEPPPPPAPAPQNSRDNPEAAQGPSSSVTRLILENARQQEAQQMRRYYRPLPPRQPERDQPDW
ncbi:MAG: hypothetical protein HGA97_01330 [Chlorobiaceae bacterium]|nr:hypothetical protein [Chlorobiaceae bacterium]